MNVASIFCLVTIVLAALPVQAMEDNSLPSGLEPCVEKGLSFLSRQQSPEGWFEGSASHVTVTARATLAFLAAGKVPDTGRYGLTLRASIEWLLSQQTADGYIGHEPREMRAHALATLALVEACGVDPNPERRGRVYQAAKKALTAIVAAQQTPKSDPSPGGGWGVEPNSPASDLADTAVCLLALRARQDLGIIVPVKSLEQARGFVLKCQDHAGRGFGWQPGGPAQVTSSAAAVISLALLDQAPQNAAPIGSATAYLRSHPIDAASSIGYSGSSLVVLCAFEVGGDYWNEVGEPLVMRVMKAQQKDGGWPESKSAATTQPVGRTMATAMALQTLTIPYRLLPVYQR